MAFNYTPGTPDDVTRVRYHISDTDEDTAIFQDEEINFVLSEEGSVGKAVVSLIGAIMRKLAHEPDLQADWLRVDWRRSAENWRAMLNDKRREFGLGMQVGSAVRHPYRTDSLQTETPSYAEDDD